VEAGWTRLDWLLTAIVVISVVLSMIKGFTRELISLGATLWGVLMAIWFYDRVAPWFAPYVKTAAIAKLVAFLAILVAVLVLGAVVSSFAGRLVKKVGLRWFDRLLGAGFGLVRGVLVAWAVTLALVVFPPGPGVVERSWLAPYMAYGARLLVSVAPEELRRGFQSGWEEARKIWSKRAPVSSH